MGLGGFVVATWRVAPLVFWAPVGPAARELSAPCVVACGSAGVPGAVWCVGGPGCFVCPWAAARPRAVRAASFARRVASKPGQAPPPPTGTAADPSGALHTGGAWCARGRRPAREHLDRRVASKPGLAPPPPTGTAAWPSIPPAPSTPAAPGLLMRGWRVALKPGLAPKLS